MATLTLNCLVNGTGTLTGHFYIRANNDENWTNNYARIDIDVPFTDLKSTARVPGSLSPGQTFNYTVTVVNMGVENATNTQMQINLPSNVEYQSHTATKGTFNPQTGIWTIGTLTYNNDDNESDDALGENATLVLTLKVKPDSAAGTYNITTNTTCDLSLLSIFQASPTTALRITDTNKIQLIISNPTGVRQRHVIYITIIDGSKTIKRSYNFYLGAGGTRTISLGNLHRNATIKITQYTYNAERTAKTIQYTQKLKSIAHENSKTTTVQKVKGRQRQAIKRITRATINNQFQIVYT
jgi:conserved repeat domain